MINFFKQELLQIYPFFKNNFQELVVLCAATLFLVMVICRPIASSLVANYSIYYLLFPIITIAIILRKNPLDFGFRLGDCKLWSLYLILTFLIVFLHYTLNLFFLQKDSIILNLLTIAFSFPKHFPFFLVGSICFVVLFFSDLKKGLKRRVYLYQYCLLCSIILESRK